MFPFDQTVFLFFNQIHTPFLDLAFYMVSWFFNFFPALLLFIIVSIALFEWSSRKSMEKLLYEFWGSIILSTVLVWGIKIWVNSPRPALALISAFGPSFPSAHTALATTFFLFFLRFHFGNNFFRNGIHIAFCFLCPIIVGMSRLYLDVHWFTDVLFGFVIGVTALLISDYIWNTYHHHAYSKVQ